MFAEGLGRFTGAMTLGYLDKYGLDPEGKERKTRTALDQMIGLANGPLSRSDCQASLQKALARNDLRVAEVLTQPTRIYGHDLGDMIAFAFINKLPMIDHNLARQIAYVSGRLQESPMSSTCASMSADQGPACSRWLNRSCSSQWRSSSFSRP